MDTTNNNAASPAATNKQNFIEPSAKTTSPQPWTRTGDKLMDDLNLFSTGSFYDCTFKLSNDVTGESKLFRCHKVFLATCSEPFEKMLYGCFKEANVDRDFEISISKTSPDVFELAMSYVYGRSVDFKSSELAVHVYLFAREWMIQHLMVAVEKFLVQIICAKDALNILQHVLEETNAISAKCLELIEKSALKVVTSKSWLEASEKVVIKVLRLQYLNIAEASLFRSLVTWGRAGAEDDVEARSKIDNGLKLIRFCTMSWASFSKLCCQPLPLSNEEKLKIILSITQRNADLQPEGFSTCKWPRCLSTKYTIYKWATFKATNCTVDSNAAPVILKVAIDTQRYLTGLSFKSLTAINAGEKVQLTCDVYNPEQLSVPMATATFNSNVEKNSSGLLPLNWPILMRPGISYTIKVSYQHTAKRASAMFASEKSYRWNANSKEEELTVNLECQNNFIIDIFGLVLRKGMVVLK